MSQLLIVSYCLYRRYPAYQLRRHQQHDDNRSHCSGIKQYNMDEFKKNPEEEAKIWEAYFKDRSDENRNKIVEIYAGLVHYIAGKMAMAKPTNIPGLTPLLIR